MINDQRLKINDWRPMINVKWLKTKEQWSTMNDQRLKINDQRVMIKV